MFVKMDVYMIQLWLLALCGTCYSEDLQYLKSTVEPRYLYPSNDTCLNYACLDSMQPIKCNKTELLLDFENITCDYIDLSFLKALDDLKEFWFVGTGAYQRRLKQKTVHINFSIKKGENLSLSKIHINSYMRNQNYILEQLLHSSPSLTVVDLSYSRFITWISNLSKVIKIIGGYNITVLSLKMCTHTGTELSFFYNLNITEIFWPLRNTNLQYLDMSYNNLLNFNGSLLAVLPNLKYINLAGNILQQYSELILLRQMLIYHRNIEEITADYLQIKEVEEYATDMPSHATKQPLYPSDPDSPSHATKRSVSINDPFVDRCFKAYNATINNVIFSQPLFCKVAKCIIIKSEPDIIHVPCEQFPSAKEALSWLDGKCFQNVQIPMAPQLKSLTVSNRYSKRYLILNKPLCFAPNKLEQITVKDGTYFAENSRVTGLNKLKNLTLVNLLGIRINMDKSILNLPALELLLISKCQVNTDNTTELVNIMPNLKQFLFSNNNITHLPYYMFRNYSKLETISLEWNYLSEFDLDLTDSKSLKLINLAHNTIQYFTQRTIASMKYNFKTYNSSMTVDIGNNQLLCTCNKDALSTIEFITTSQTYGVSFIFNDNLLCSSEVGSHIVKNITYADFQHRCFPSKVKLIVSTTLVNFGVMMIFVISGLSYKFRYRFYTTILRLRWKCKSNNQSNNNFVYDAFISYCSEDRFWVHGVLMKELEDKYGFKLCIHYRDFLVGPIVDEIVDKVTKSRCIVVVLSNNSVRSHWVQYELHLAHSLHVQRGKRLIILKLGEIDMSLVKSPLVKQLLESIVYIEFPEATEDSLNDSRETRKLKAKTELFWVKISNILYNKTKMSGGSGICCCYKKINYSVINDSTMTLLED